MIWRYLPPKIVGTDAPGTPASWLRIVYCPMSRSCVSFRPSPFSVMSATGRLDASNFCTIGGSVPGGSRRRSAIARFEISLTSESALVPGWKNTLMMLTPGSEREESLESSGDIRFDLLRWHPAVERRHHDLRDVDVREQVHRHPHHAGEADHGHHQADDDDEVGITNA